MAHLDPPLRAKVRDYHANEMRFRMVKKLSAARYDQLEARAAREAKARVELYKQFAELYRDTLISEKASASDGYIARGDELSA